MEDRKIKRAYEIVAEDLEKFCKGGAHCNDCILYEVCGDDDKYLHRQIDMAKDILFGKED